MARRSEVASVGIDVERIGRLDETRWPFVFTAAELQVVNGAAANARAGIVAALFSAKEAYYKCRYQVVRDPLGFHDAEIALTGSSLEVRPAEGG